MCLQHLVSINLGISTLQFTGYVISVNLLSLSDVLVCVSVK